MIRMVCPHPMLGDVTAARDSQKATPCKKARNDNKYSLLTPPPTHSWMVRCHFAEADSDSEVQCLGVKIGGIVIMDLSNLVGPQLLVTLQSGEKKVVKEESDSEVTIAWSNIPGKRGQSSVLPDIEIVLVEYPAAMMYINYELEKAVTKATKESQFAPSTFMAITSSPKNGSSSSKIHIDPVLKRVQDEKTSAASSSEFNFNSNVPDIDPSSSKQP
ncbi:hypothetical protein ARMGADRAFT_1140554 [Armillaria gallica]|uniref:Uncharacterized protein n=1 Tax=Armillaria gallica TaxID=47427 RepID=A0A2H3CW96_ARMGA|nr:hypothetical protein ARMGADRAFT_1140554 [Armillaria gallica]